MHLHLSASLGLLTLTSHALAQGAVGPGIAPVAAPVATQQPTVTNARSLVTINGVTTAQEIPAYTIPFASTALGGWDLGPKPRVGSIGLGDIKGKIGEVKSKRGAVETGAAF